MWNSETKKYLTIGTIAVAVCLIVRYFSMILEFFGGALKAAAPLFIGCVMAYVLNILLKKVEKYYFPNSKNARVNKSRRPVCIVLSLLLLVAIIAVILDLVVPELFSSIRLITNEIPPLAESLRIWALEHSEELPTLQDALSQTKIDWPDLFRKVFNFVAVGAGGIIDSVFSMLMSVFGTAAQLLIGLIFAIYILLGKDTIKGQIDRGMRAWMPDKLSGKIREVAETFHETFTSFITGQFTEAVIIGCLCAGGMMVLRIPYAVMTGTVVGVTALIPVVGAYLGAVVGAFMVFTVAPLKALIFLIFLAVLQQLEGNLIYPKVVGSSIGLPGIWVLAAVTVGGGIMGISGMLLGVPLAAAIYKLLGKAVETRLDKIDRIKRTDPLGNTAEQIRQKGE